MYVHTYIYTHLHIYTYIHIEIHTYTYMYTHPPPHNLCCCNCATYQGSLRLQLRYFPANTGVNDAKSAIAAALHTLSPEEQEEILGVSFDGPAGEGGGGGVGLEVGAYDRAPS